MKRFNVGDFVVNNKNGELMKVFHCRDDGVYFLERFDGSFCALEDRLLDLSEYEIKVPLIEKDTRVKVLNPYCEYYNDILPVINIFREFVNLQTNRGSFTISICLVQVVGP